MSEDKLNALEAKVEALAKKIKLLEAQIFELKVKKRKPRWYP